METKWVDYVKNIGLVGVLVIALYLGFKGDWVFGSALKEEQARTATAIAERDRWQKLALQGTRFAEESAMKTTSLKTSNIPVNQNSTPDDIQARLDRVKDAIHPGIEDPEGSF